MTQMLSFKKKDKCMLKDLMNEIGMAIEDILDTIQVNQQMNRIL
jgi:DNA-binding IscR family transcriptional regulator